MLGVLTGVVSRGETLSRSLGVGEWWSGGGVSRESSFTDFVFDRWIGEVMMLLCEGVAAKSWDEGGMKINVAEGRIRPWWYPNQLISLVAWTQVRSAVSRSRFSKFRLGLRRRQVMRRCGRNNGLWDACLAPFDGSAPLVGCRLLDRSWSYEY